MARAIALAARASYRTSPNPMVGAVVVDARGEPVGEGYHRRPGAPHAEAEAIVAAGERARGGTLYVSLEPCAHQGRTPPCVEAIVAAGLRRVVVAMLDPDPRVRGRGVERLREAGIGVDVGPLEARARRLNEFYVKHRSTGRPFVSVKFAASLDGKIATRTGHSRWITGPAARAHAHRLRHRHDAILVGVNTVLRDDPALTARFPGARQPLKIVLDSRGRTPTTAKVREGRLLIDRGRDLPGLLDRLGSMGIISLLVEGGATVHGSFFDAGLVDRVYAYLAPVIVGGREAPSAVGGRGPAAVTESLRLHRLHVERLGEDLLIVGDVHRDR
ncbi:MAG TPA: bifunctional diaminohydroxyphosphoribosylaminopyrimidine deaminase/5-amino-6-(5-phosphoribosylamino)uracil reductase RibD [Candidatus Dormibacteraeota bacterium]|nr:bifunctional diaminohydroxyphosphoribosylaminopyrimidine deaminase/5-amino-6-(5-phosphoribosylamino)uracil reductase RibD [Candidatus Dormibacteraeota bacterium]